MPAATRTASAQESQGAIYDRSNEHLAYTDRGVILLRRLYKESIESVKNGGDPVGVVRDPAKNEIDSAIRPYEEKLD